MRIGMESLSCITSDFRASGGISAGGPGLARPVRCFTLVVGYISANWILNKAVANKIDFETADCAADNPCGIEIVSIEKGKITKIG